jgi:hypothetical protein
MEIHYYTISQGVRTPLEHAEAASRLARLGTLHTPQTVLRDRGMRAFKTLTGEIITAFAMRGQS